MSDNIPEEVMVSILLRLRVKDLVSCRRVSKQWLSIIDDPHFISRQLQLSISSNSNAALFLQDRYSPILFCKENSASDINLFSRPIPCESSRVLLMGSCHGLVCFSHWDNPDYFVVLNPSTGERHTVSSPIKLQSEPIKLEAYGFGYDESSDDYKVVRIVQTEIGLYSHSNRAEIYGVRSKGFFRTIPLPTACWRHRDRKSIGVFVRGSIHWCTKNRTNTYPYEHVIDAIDLVSNTYHQLQFCDYNTGESWFDEFNVGIVDSCLSLCIAHKEGWKIGIWVMEEYGNSESWNRVYCILCESHFPRAVTSVGSNGDKFLLMLDWQEFFWCGAPKDADETILINYTRWWYGSYEAMYCLESLVKIFPNHPADVKKDADEKQLKNLEEQEITEDEHPAFLNLRSLKALMYGDYIEEYTWDDDYNDEI